jgi:hypothetical protein
MTATPINPAFTRGYQRLDREDAIESGRFLALAKLALDNALIALPTGHPLAREVFSSIATCEGVQTRLRSVLQGQEPDL